MSTAVATRNDNKALEVVGQVRQMLNERDGQLVSLLGSGIPLERFKTVALHALNSNPDLLRCSPLSIVEAIREAAALRLEPTGLLGDAYLVKYGDNARLMPGYRGLMKLARRSGDVVNIDAQVVYASDVFDVQLGTEPRIEHIPLIDGDRGSYRGAYAWARLQTGELVIDWMSYADIEQVRKSSKAAQSGPWVGFWSEMARKTVIRRLMKRLPLTTEADRALELEAEAEHETPKPLTARVSKIHERLGIAQPVTEEPAQPEDDPPSQAEPERPVVTADESKPAAHPPNLDPVHDPDLEAGLGLLDRTTRP